MAGNIAYSISAHAAQRYIERVEPGLTVDEARAEIRSHERAIQSALSIGCQSVRLANGVRIIVDCQLGQVVTVLPAPPKFKRGQSIQRSGFRLDFSAIKRRHRRGFEHAE